MKSVEFITTDVGSGVARFWLQ